MTIIRKYRFLALGVAMLLGALLVNALISPVRAQSNRGNGGNSGSGSNTPSGTAGSMMNGANSNQNSGGMMGGGNMMGGMMNGMMGGTTNATNMMSDVDRHFIEEMIPHHQAAIDMADLALQKAQHPELKALASSIKEVQTNEIAQMRAWYKSWYGEDVPTQSDQNNDGMMGNMDMMSGGMMGCGMDGMDGNDESSLKALESATDFDKAFLDQMIPHHRMAVMMSSMVLSNGEKPELQDLARSIVNSQSAEIQKMRGWYQTWYGSTNQNP